MLRVSIVASSCRPGGMELVKMSLDWQTFRDFEFVFVDRYWELRKDILTSYFKDYSFIHIPPKIRTEYIDSGSAWNTGFIFASGELVLMMGDYTLYMPTWVEEHLHLYEEFAGKASLVGERTRVMTPEYKPDFMTQPISIFKDELTSDKVKVLPVSRFEDQKIRRLKQIDSNRWEVSFRSFLLSANESLPREVIMKINGLDEAYNSTILSDGSQKFMGWGHQDENMGLRLSAIGHRFIYDNRASRPIHIEIKHLISPKVGETNPKSILVKEIEDLAEGKFDVVADKGILSKSELEPLFAPAFDHWIDMAKVLIIAPQIFPCGGDTRYQGIERLAYLWAEELSHRGAEVYVAAPTGSQFPIGVKHIDTGPCDGFVEGERRALGTYRFALAGIESVLDFTHSHFAMREFNLPAVCWTWHDPGAIQPPLPEYNVLALSDWQRIMLYAFQKTNARVFDCHCGHVPEFQVPSSRSSFIFIGRAHPTKGMLEAAEMCHELGVQLNIIGGLGPNDDRIYLDKVLDICRRDGRIIYWGQVTDIVKDSFLRSAKAVLHPLQKGYVEAHSHKCVDALLYGVPIISYGTGAMTEVVEHGLSGFIAGDREDFKHWMKQVDMLDRSLIKALAIERWSVARVIDRAIPLMKEVYRGLRW